MNQMSNDTATAKLRGAGGTLYSFDVIALNEPMQPAPGIYAYMRRHPAGGWTACYLGAADDLSASLDARHQMDRIVEAGATHVWFRVMPNRLLREAELEDLLAYHQPPCND